MSSTLVHVGVRSTDLEKTIRFWRDGLGLRVVSQRDDECYDLSDGHHNFRVFQHKGPERPSHVSGMLDYLHIGIRVANLEETAQRLLDMGYEIFSDGLDGKIPLDVHSIGTGLRWTSPPATTSGPASALGNRRQFDLRRAGHAEVNSDERVIDVTFRRTGGFSRFVRRQPGCGLDLAARAS